MKKNKCSKKPFIIGLILLIVVIAGTLIAYNAVSPSDDEIDSNANPNWKEPPTEQSPPPSQTTTQKEWVDAPAGYWGKPVPEDAIWIP